MKNLLLLLTLIILASCSGSDLNEDCNCTSSLYERETYTYFDNNGLPRTGIRENLLSTTNVGCSEEGTTELGNNTFSEVTCE